MFKATTKKLHFYFEYGSEMPLKTSKFNQFIFKIDGY